jgi:uncharacterized cysteine cluster protein YcgN (CxxCxxCC family)
MRGRSITSSLHACIALLSRALAVRDHMGPDCRFLNFTEGEEIAVYVKLAGEREDLWAGSVSIQSEELNAE